MVNASRALYSSLRYWRSAGLRYLEIPDISEEQFMNPEERLANKELQLEELQKDVSGCNICATKAMHEKAIFGQGNLNCDLMFITSATHDDVEKGALPLSGEDGELFDRMIEKMEINRDKIFLSFATKGEILEESTPEKPACDCPERNLMGEIEIVAPKAICTLGTLATTQVIKTKQPIARLRGQAIPWNNTLVFPTFHPAYLLKKKAARNEVWQDMLSIMAHLKQTRNKSA